MSFILCIRCLRIWTSAEPGTIKPGATKLIITEPSSGTLSVIEPVSLNDIVFILLDDMLPILFLGSQNLRELTNFSDPNLNAKH